MDSLEINKAAAAVLVAGIAFMGAGLLGEALVHPAPLKQAAIKIDAPVTATATAAAPPADPPVAFELASADPERGKADTLKQGCIACHSFNEGGKAGVGPNLYGIIGAPHAHMVGYEYSSALKGKQGPWTYDELYQWLKNPRAYAPGTKMSYAGWADPQGRADIIAYLRTLAATPEPLPPKPVLKASAEAPAGAPAAAAAGGEPGIDTLLASADPAAGQKQTLTSGCIACHSFNEGGKNGLGPNLYGVVGGPHAHMAGYEYSNALKSHQGPWTYEELDKWLAKPSAYAPGTKMSFAGLSDPKARANVIAYLRTLAHDPEPLPSVKQ